MTKPIAQHNNFGFLRWYLPKSAPERRSLNYHDVYPCPICRHGQLSALTLMDALACNACHHIFTADLKNQSVRVEDISQPSVWRWNGLSWQIARPRDGEIAVTIWLVVGVAIALISATLVWLMTYLFPPLEGSKGFWIPQIWPVATLSTHLVLLVLWPLAEYFQLPFYVALKIRIQTLLARR